MSDETRPHPDDYGPNVWLIEEKYRQYKEFPESVGEGWREFLSAYQPLDDAVTTNGPGTNGPPPSENGLHEAAVAAANAGETTNGPAPSPAPAPVAPLPPAPAPPSGPAPSSPAAPPTKPKAKSESAPAAKESSSAAGVEPIRGVAAKIVENMEESLSVPTATSVRDVPMRLLEENRRLLNKVLKERGRKISFTHLIAWAIQKALEKHPSMTSSFREIDGVPHRIVPEHVNFGLAVDVEKKDGSRSLLVPNIKQADTLDFQGFLDGYDELIQKVRRNRIMPDDFAGTTLTLTNPGMIGTVHSIPRLMAGQGLIIGTGSIDYPAEFRSADPRMLAKLGVSKTMTLTSTYDHRVIQGAESGQFLQEVDRLIQGEDQFYDDIFESLGIPHEPVRITRDSSPSGPRHALREKEAKVLQLINMYRVRGHLIANTNPLATEIPAHSELDPEYYGLSVFDFDREFLTGGLAGHSHLTLRDILDTLQEAYCQTIGIEYMHIQEPEQKEWLRERIEGSKRAEWCDLETKWRVLNKLNAAEAFEKFLHTKYVGHKRFSLEGAETLIPLLDLLFTRAIDEEIDEAVIGMAHRGRLNVLANVLGKSYEKMFREFEGDLDPESLDGSGDVKYHLGATGVHTIPNKGAVRLTLASNPSHLEAVNPVVEGMARAKQDRREDHDRSKVLPVLIHGDAAFAGQGVVAETLNLSDLKGYQTGGTVHIVVNNGIGFTTAPVDARSSVYPTDVAKMVQAPIFHVNGNDPEACVRVIELALSFRQRFGKDVVVDMMCYRKHGHNEGDEPAFTQPLMYAKIKDLRSVRLLYTDFLVKRGDIAQEEAEQALADFRARLEAAFEATHDSRPPDPILPKDPMLDDANPSVDTGIPRETIQRVLKGITEWPEDFHVHPKLEKLLEQRARMLAEDSVDWATGEALAFGSLALEGTPVRLSGQDSRRGTFAHRHSVLIDQENGGTFTPLNHIEPEQPAKYQVYDSLLSEFAVMGFDYGYSVSAEDSLVLWEAQFGDFNNGAQIIIDQFLSSAEEKWRQMSRLTLLLPHGYEGQGPEHSSARLERFLTLCAKRNLRVATPTTAAQYFHLLRRQVHQNPAKPLVVMTPKSLLRAPSAKSKAADFSDEKFHLILDDLVRDKDSEKLLFCTGKIAYDLMKFRDKHDIGGCAIIRFEQLYPFPADDMQNILRRYPRARQIKWVQEEPKNMGAWTYMLSQLRERLPEDYDLSFAGRPPAGSPAAGSQAMHTVEHEYLTQQAFFT